MLGVRAFFLGGAAPQPPRLRRAKIRSLQAI